MIKTKISEIVRIVNGKSENLELDLEVELTAIIDSRKASENTFFAAFRGDNVDGHDYVEQAIKNGAQFALTSKAVNFPHILVSDVAKALADLARFNRSQLPNLKVIGITGSSGKTTTKDLLAHLLSIVGTTVAPSESLNNELGVPLLILNCNLDTKYCVVEMGARHRGDIAYLTEIAQPNIGVVLCVGSLLSYL